MENRLPEPTPPPNGAPRGERVPKGWLHLAALGGLTLLGLYFCYRLAEPFLPALAWALALAIIAHPMHKRLAKVIPGRDWAAVVSTAVVLVVVVVPGLAVAAQLANEAAAGEQKAREVAGIANEPLAGVVGGVSVGENRARGGGGWRAALDEVPWLSNLLARIEGHFDLEAEVRRLVAGLTQGVGGIVTGSIWGLFQFLIMVFVLYFAFRDQDHLLAGLRKLLPVTRQECDHLFTRTADSVHATVYATVVTGVIQGVTGGLLFWALGIPAPVLWGVVMTILGILPILGAFLVWVPAAVVLAVDGQWGSAGLVVLWGVLMAGPVGNWLYGYLAGGRLRLHPVPSLLAYVGGLAVFGISGMVLGPVVLAVTLALVEMWQRRAGSTATPVEGQPAAADESAHQPALG